MNRKKVLILIIIFTMLVTGLIIILNHSTAYKKLCVNESTWNNIKSSRKESDNHTIEYIDFNGYNLIIDRNSNTLYYSLVNDSPSKFNPQVRYKLSNQNAKLVILSDEITNEKVKSDYKFKIMIYDSQEYHIYDLKCTDLPLINIQFEGNEKEIQKRLPMKIHVFNNLSNTPNRITISDGKIKPIGKDFVFSLNKMTPGKNKRENPISILNMKPSSEYILKSIDGTENITSGHKGQRVELFINNMYIGTYSLEYMQERENV